MPREVLKAAGKNQDEFLEEILPIFNVEPNSFETRHNTVNYNRWANNLGSRFYNLRTERGHILAILHKLDEFEVYDYTKSGCHFKASRNHLQENCRTTVKVTKERMIGEALGPFVFQNMNSAEDREIFKETKRRSRYSGWTHLTPVVYDPTSKFLLSVFNFIYLAVNKEVLGTNFNSVIDKDGRDSGRVGPRTLARRLYRTESAEKEMIFKSSKDLSGKIYKLVKDAAIRDFDRVIEFDNQIESTVQEIINNNSTHTSDHFHFEMIIGESPIKVPWIEYIVKSGQVSLDTFHDETNAFFKD